MNAGGRAATATRRGGNAAFARPVGGAARQRPCAQGHADGSRDDPFQAITQQQHTATALPHEPHYQLGARHTPAGVEAMPGWRGAAQSADRCAETTHHTVAHGLCSSQNVHSRPHPHRLRRGSCVQFARILHSKRECHTRLAISGTLAARFTLCTSGGMVSCSCSCSCCSGTTPSG